MTEEPQVVEFNGVQLERRADCAYAHDYWLIAKDIEADPQLEIELLRALCVADRWFFCYFVMGIPVANHPFWVEACKELDDSEAKHTHTLDLWARFHGKSSAITTAGECMAVLRNPEERICIFGWKQEAARTFLRQIKTIFEQSEFLKALFPDILYQDPIREAAKWSEDIGIFVKRRTMAKEPSVMSAGLVESMPTGFHFTRRIYDDIMTDDFARSPEVIEKLINAFDLSRNLGTGQANDVERIIGTPYHHDDVLMNIKARKDENGAPLYHLRFKPATIDGTPNGASVYLPEAELARLRVNKRTFYSQQLLNPTPTGTEKLNYRLIKEVKRGDLPERLYRFMVIDPAGLRTTKVERQDAWAMYVVGVEPYRDDVGASDIFILDAFIDSLPEADAYNKVVELYCRNGRILKLGVEKVGMSTTEIHISNALRAKGRHLTLDNGGLVILRPAGRKKELRIEQSLSWPLQNGKVHMLESIPSAYKERLRMEMERFPFWHDDGLDALSYVYDLIKDYRFPVRDLQAGKREEEWDKAFAADKSKASRSWMMV